MEQEKQPAPAVWRDVAEPGWREREAEYAEKFLAAVPPVDRSAIASAWAERVKLFEAPTLAQRIDAAIAHAEEHDELRHMLWPHQQFALSLGELLRAAKRGV